MEGRNLIILLVILAFGLAGWYTFMYSGQKSALDKVSAQLNDFNLKVGQARRAQSDIKVVESRFQVEALQLENEKSRFIKKNELSIVTTQMDQMARKYNLKLEDFSPSMENYFENTPDAKIMTLPVEITVTGLYLDLGRYLENWPQLPFYILPHAISIEPVDLESNVIRTRIMTKLYTWNN
jgi:Tfp pilus assembly protein PilO